MLLGLCRWIHPASGHRCVLGLVNCILLASHICVFGSTILCSKINRICEFKNIRHFLAYLWIKLDSNHLFTDICASILLFSYADFISAF